MHGKFENLVSDDSENGEFAKELVGRMGAGAKQKEEEKKDSGTISPTNIWWVRKEEA